jgi:hypothetical protein
MLNRRSTRTMGTNRGCYCFAYRAHGLHRAVGSDSDHLQSVDGIWPSVLGDVQSKSGAHRRCRRVCRSGLYPVCA